MLDVKLNTPELFIYLSAYTANQPRPSTEKDSALYWACCAVARFRGESHDGITATYINEMFQWVQKNASAAMGDVAPTASDLRVKLEELSDSWEKKAHALSEQPGIAPEIGADQLRTCTAELRAVLGELNTG